MSLKHILCYRIRCSLHIFIRNWGRIMNTLTSLIQTNNPQPNKQKKGKLRIILLLTYVAKPLTASNKEMFEFKWQMTTFSALAVFIKQKAGVNDCNSTKNRTIASEISLCISLNCICPFRFGYMHKIKQNS